MKIAYVVSLATDVPPRSKNGLEFIAHWIAEGMQRRGHEVTLFATDNSQTSGKLVSLFPQDLHSFNDPKNPAWSATFRGVWNTTYVASQADSFDIIHSHTGTIAFSIPFIKTPVVQTLHHPFKNDPLMSVLESKSSNPQLSFLIKQYNTINYVAVSRKQKENFLQAPHIFTKLSHIHNAIPVDSFIFSDKAGEYLLYIGFITEDKGAHIAVQVARTLGIKLVIAGSKEGQEEYFVKYIEPYLSDQITYVGPVDFEKKVELYKNALATVAPLQWDEPFGLTLIESQACGTPVIAFNKGAASEIIEHNNTGFVVDTFDDMCEAVKNIKSIDRATCRKWVEKQFNIERMVDEYEKLYENLNRNHRL